MGLQHGASVAAVARTCPSLRPCRAGSGACRRGRGPMASRSGWLGACGKVGGKWYTSHNSQSILVPHFSPNGLESCYLLSPCTLVHLVSLESPFMAALADGIGGVLGAHFPFARYVHDPIE